jgi:hypothetical protein
MNKIVLYSSLIIFGIIGGYIPVLFGADPLGGWSLLGGTVGSIVGIIVAYKLKDSI